MRKSYPSIVFIKGDICVLEELDKVAGEIDLIVHAAAQVAVTTSLVDPLTDF